MNIVFSFAYYNALDGGWSPVFFARSRNSARRITAAAFAGDTSLSPNPFYLFELGSVSYDELDDSKVPDPSFVTKNPMSCLSKPILVDSCATIVRDSKESLEDSDML